MTVITHVFKTVEEAIAFKAGVEWADPGHTGTIYTGEYGSEFDFTDEEDPDLDYIVDHRDE
jgi:hypothetical protein